MSKNMDKKAGSKKRKRDNTEAESTEKLEPPVKKVKLNEEKEKYSRTYTGMYQVSDLVNGGRRTRKIGTFDSLEEANKGANGFYEFLKIDPTLVKMYGKDHWGTEMIHENRPGYPLSKFMICGIGSSSHTVCVREAFPQELQVSYLKSALEKRNLSSEGKKKELVTRLVNDIARQKKEQKK